MAKSIIVTSVSPMPRRVAGVPVAFLGTTAFPMDTFAGWQMKAIMADRVLTVAVGEVLDEAGVDALIAERERDAIKGVGAVGAVPAVPHVPAVPAVPAVPHVPAAPHVPAVPHVPAGGAADAQGKAAGKPKVLGG